MSTAFKYKFFFFILFSVNNAFALSTEGLFLFRSNDAFDSTMYRLKNNLQKNGYDYVKVQSVDKGLKVMVMKPIITELFFLRKKIKWQN